MKTLELFIESGILETYVLGLTSEEENKQVREMILLYPEIDQEIDKIMEALIIYSKKSAPAFDPTLKSLIMGTIDYTERLTNGEAPTFPPSLNENSKVEDFSEWLNRKDLELPENTEDISLRIIGYEPEKMTAIVRILVETPYEIHDKEYEKFLILEGTCDIVTDTKTYSLVPGDYYCVPLNLGHVVKVTSKIPCKVILQRAAA